MSASAPQGTGDAGAEGGHCFTLGGFDSTGKVPDVNLPNTEVQNNVVRNIDVTSVANDMPGDHDYDDPYPGGPTGSLGVPGDG